MVVLALGSRVDLVLPTAAETTEAQPSLAGQLLVASPSMTDPRFDRAVIVMIRHHKEGALGVVINRPVGESSIALLLAMLGDTDASVSGEVRIFAGGPVQPEKFLALHSADYRRAETFEIDGRLAMTSSGDVLRDIGNNKGPNKALVVFGYSSWLAGQLERELARRIWTVAPAEPGVVFDEDRDKVWEAAYSKRMREL